MRTIIFISGFMVPQWLAKSKFVWDDTVWKDYRRIYLSSKTPISDSMVSRELDKLAELTRMFPDSIVAGHSLGAWWAANLACHSQFKIKKLVFWTPLSFANDYPIFNVTERHHPLHKQPNIIGPDKVLNVEARFDFVVRAARHAHPLRKHFRASSYRLDGGHFFQDNHQKGLSFMKEWIELE